VSFDDIRGMLRLPVHVQVGFGAIAEVAPIVAAHGSRALLVADPFLADDPVLLRLRGEMERAGVAVRPYTEISPELPAESLVAAAHEAAGFDPDVVVAIGGGSALDAGKLIALLLAHGGPLSRYYGENRVPGAVVPIVAVPTTAGTGSEVTPVAVVSDPERAMKVGISSPYLIPVAALVDPELTLGAPPTVTAYSGIDALVHAVESYTAATLPGAGPLPVFTGRNALTAPLSLAAAARIHRWLPVAVSTPGDRQARGEMALGALQAGIAFGPTGTHLSHALQYPLGSMTKTPHGLGTGLFLPYVLDALLTHPPTAERLGDLADAVGLGRDGGAFVRSIVDLNAAIGVPASLRDLDVQPGQLPDLADGALGSARLIAIAPVPVDRELLMSILTAAQQGTLTEAR